eukprot:1023873-Pyramimonas_sp.AAC.1
MCPADGPTRPRPATCARVLLIPLLLSARQPCLQWTMGGVLLASLPSPAHGGERPLPMGASAVRSLVSRCVSLRCFSMTLGQSTWSWYSLSIL